MMKISTSKHTSALKSIISRKKEGMVGTSTMVIEHP